MPLVSSTVLALLSCKACNSLPFMDCSTFLLIHLAKNVVSIHCFCKCNNYYSCIVSEIFALSRQGCDLAHNQWSVSSRHVMSTDSSQARGFALRQSERQLVSSCPNAELPSMRKITHCIDKITNRIVPNSHAPTRARHRVSQPYTTALPSPSLPTRPESPILTNSRSEGLSVNHARRCTSFAILHVTAVD